MEAAISGPYSEPCGCNWHLHHVFIKCCRINVNGCELNGSVEVAVIAQVAYSMLFFYVEGMDDNILCTI